jgi:hypothetical protein
MVLQGPIPANDFGVSGRELLYLYVKGKIMNEYVYCLNCGRETWLSPQLRRTRGPCEKCNGMTFVPINRMFEEILEKLKSQNAQIDWLQGKVFGPEEE